MGLLLKRLLTPFILFIVCFIILQNHFFGINDNLLFQHFFEAAVWVFGGTFVGRAIIIIFNKMLKNKRSIGGIPKNR